MSECKNKWHYQPHPDVKRCPDCNQGREPGETFHFYPAHPIKRLAGVYAVDPYRTPGEIDDMPRPIEIEFKVSLFVRGGDSPGMDSREKLAQDFEKYIEENMVNEQVDFGRRTVIAVEVKPYETQSKDDG